MPQDFPPSIAKSAKDPSLEVSVRVGRGGISEALVSELSDQLRRKRLGKVKANKGIANDSSERSEIFESIAEVTGSKLVFQRGNVAVYWQSK